jgi:NTE family protein
MPNHCLLAAGAAPAPARPPWHRKLRWLRHALRHVLLLGAAGVAMGVAAADPARAETAPRLGAEPHPVVGVVLGGGGARGIAHVGVLKVLEELRIPVDLIVGTSMGAIVGGFYASGMSATELEDILTDINWNHLFTDLTERGNRPFRRKRDDDLGLPGPKLGLSRRGIIFTDGLLSGQNIELFFQSAVLPRTQARDFDQLPIRFRAVAADLQTGRPVILDHGSLAQSMRASMSLPALFSPVNRNGLLLVDGGIGNNLPVDIARAMGADVIIAVDVSSPLARRDELTEFTGVSEQLSRLLVHPNTLSQIELLQDGDVLIRPQLGDAIHATSFNAAEIVVRLGESAAWDAAGVLVGLSLPDADYARHIESRLARQGPLRANVLDFIELTNDSPMADAVILNEIDAGVGESLDVRALERSIGRLHSRGQFKLVRYELVTRGNETGLNLEIVPDARTPHLLEYGASINGDGRDNRFALRLAYLRTHLDSFGSEWRVFGQGGDPSILSTEFYKPLDRDLHYFLLPSAYLRQREVNVFATNGNQLGTLREFSRGSRLALGRSLGADQELQFGLHRFTGHIDVRSGTDLIEDHGFSGAEVFVNFRRDTLDDRYLPASGSSLQIDFIAARTALGADNGYDQVRLDYIAAATRGRNVLTLHARAGATIHDDAPLHSRFAAGGFGNLSGLRENELLGQHLGLIAVDYRRRVFNSNLLPGFLGVSVEYGNVWDRGREVTIADGLINGAIYFGYRSPVGPFVFGYGFGERAGGNLFVNLGRRF